MINSILAKDIQFTDEDVANQTIVHRPSKIDESFHSYVFFAPHSNYKEISGQLSQIDSVAALVTGTKSIIFDGEQIIEENLDMDHIIAIEAHEIAHSYLNHKTMQDEQQEKEADLLAVFLLESQGYHRAAEYIKTRMMDMYNFDVDDVNF